MKFLKSKWERSVCLVVTIFLLAVPGMICWQMQEPVIDVTNTRIGIDCPFYGVVVDWKDVRQVEWCGALPLLSSRTNGFAAGEVRVGHFCTKGGERIRMFSYSRVGACICFVLCSGEKLYLNLKNEERTKELFDIVNACFLPSPYSR